MHPAALIYLLFIGLYLPFVAVRSSRRLNQMFDAGEQLPRRSFYLSAFITQFLTLGLALFVAFELGLPVVGEFRWHAAATFVTALGLAALLASLPWRWRTLTPDAKRQLQLLLPASRGERPLHAALCLTAGIGEEIVYRGVLMQCLYWLLLTWFTADPSTAIETPPLSSGLWWLSGALCAISFGVAHAMQGRRAMIIVAFVALWLQVSVALTGSLWLAMTMHALYDLLSTDFLLRRLRAERQQAQQAGFAARASG
ncbi:MAG: CPBP family intramembrane glutamic endopeptidase [Planctomycetota bacterium]